VDWAWAGKLASGTGANAPDSGPVLRAHAVPPATKAPATNTAAPTLSSARRTVASDVANPVQNTG
jgi:hypothetical protein